MEERNLDLAIRNEDTREKFHTEVIRFELNQIMQHFTESVQAIYTQFELADELISTGKINEGENIWRAQIIFLTSAFDFYMHELTKYGLCEIYDENWERTEKYSNLQVSMKTIEIALKSGEDIDKIINKSRSIAHTTALCSGACSFNNIHFSTYSHNNTQIP